MEKEKLVFIESEVPSEMCAMDVEASFGPVAN